LSLQPSRQALDTGKTQHWGSCVSAQALVKTDRPLNAGENGGPSARGIIPNLPNVSAEAQPASPTPSDSQKIHAAHAIARFLRSLQVLLRSTQLYQKNHPRVLEGLEETEESLRAALELSSPVVLKVERGALLLPKLDGHALPEDRGEWKTLAAQLHACGIHSLAFLPETNLGELDTLALLLKPTKAMRAGLDWPALLAEHQVTGIRLNAPAERQMDAVLAGLMAALMAGGDTRSAGTARRPEAGHADRFGQLLATLRLLARMTESLESAQRSSPHEAAQEFRAALEEAEPASVKALVAAMARHAPCGGESYEDYVARVADALALEYARKEFEAGRVAPADLHNLFARLGHQLERVTSTGSAAVSILSRWSEEASTERLCERFWAGQSHDVAASVLHSEDAWCIPVAALRRFLHTQARETTGTSPAAANREARLTILRYARCLESQEIDARRAVAASLVELAPDIERLWPDRAAQELSRFVVRALGRETLPSIAGLLTAVAENLARLALARADYAAFESILDALGAAPPDAEFAHLRALAERFIADERWLSLVDAAVFTGRRLGRAGVASLDPALPRLLRREPERLLERLGLILTARDGLDSLPAMARLLRAVGEPTLAALETRLSDPRRQRAAAAVKLLAATQPERLLAALPCVLPNWDWSLQDLAVAELSRRANVLPPAGVARVFLATLAEAHSMVVPVMLDHIGQAQELSAVPMLLEIAAGGHARLREVFIRIKAVEALGQMRVAEAADLLCVIIRDRNGLTHTEPAGLRAAAEEALALVENRPSSTRVRAARQALEKSSAHFARPRRYLRVPLSSPLRARIEGAHPGAASVRTISLGGAFLESKCPLHVGDSFQVEFRAGLRQIRSTAVVRNLTPSGGGVEFVHMKHEDRERLRRLVSRLLHE
jgi:hypothetical protein